MSDEQTMPKQLYIVEHDADSCTHGGSARLGDVVESVQDKTIVGVYRLVEVREYIAVTAVRRVDRKRGGK